MIEPTELLPCPFCGSQARRSSGGAWFGTGCNGSQHCPAYLRGLTHRSQAEADAVWNTRTPHPTQPQAGAVPLTKEQAASLCKMGPVYAPDGQVVRTPEQYRRELEGAKLAGIRTAERAHGIKGGQHGAE